MSSAAEWLAYQYMVNMRVYVERDLQQLVRNGVDHEPSPSDMHRHMDNYLRAHAVWKAMKEGSS